MSSDGNLRSIFRDHLKVGFHWQSIETGLINAGVPDANFGADGVERFVEFKQTAGWKPHIRTEQIGWHKHRHMVGGVSFIAIRRWHDGGVRKGAAVDELWLCRGKWIAILAAKGMRDTDIPWIGVWSGGPSRWDWDSVRAALLKPA